MTEKEKYNLNKKELLLKKAQKALLIEIKKADPNSREYEELVNEWTGLVCELNQIKNIKKSENPLRMFLMDLRERIVLGNVKSR